MRSFRIGSLLGIPIKLDLTFLLVLPLFAFLIGNQLGQTTALLNELLGSSIAVETLQQGSIRWIVGFVAAVGLFVGVVLHELGHSVVAMRFGFPIDSITLWIFGGIASLSEMPEDWKQELAIAIAGPIVSVLVGAACFAGFLFVPSGLPAVQFVLGYLALLNVVLAVFNMLPGFPMDGGRVLRALLARTRPYARATKIASEVGKGFALLLGLVGLLAGNIITIGLAFFIYIGASQEAQQTIMRAAFEGVTVADVMTPRAELHTVSPDISVSELVDRMVRERHTGYPVMANGELVGMVTLDDAEQVREVERDAYTVGDVMTRDVETLSPETDAMTAITTLQQSGVGRLPVVDPRGELVGLISRSDLMTAFEIIRSSQRLKPRETLGDPEPPRRRPPEDRDAGIGRRRD